MFELESKEKDTNSNIFEETKIFLIVQHLIEFPENRKEKQKTLGVQYQWAGNPTKANQFLYDIITVQMVLRPVMVIPSITRLTKTSKNKLQPEKLLSLQYNPLEPSVQDRFHFIDRHFFDRSGWEKVIVNDNVLELDTNNIQKTMNYLDNNMTGFNDLSGINDYNNASDDILTNGGDVDDDDEDNQDDSVSSDDMEDENDDMGSD